MRIEVSKYLKNWRSMVVGDVGPLIRILKRGLEGCTWTGGTRAESGVKALSRLLPSSGNPQDESSVERDRLFGVSVLL